MDPRRRSCRLLLAVTALGGAGPALADGPVPALRIETGMHTAAVAALAVDGAGRRVLTCAGDGTARLWALPGGTLLRTLRLPGAWATPMRCALSPDGARVGIDDTHEIDLATGRVRDLEGAIRAASPTGTGFGDYATRYGEPDFHYKSDGNLGSIDRAADGRVVRSVGRQLCLYDRSLRHLSHNYLPEGLSPAAVRFSPDGKRVAVGYFGAPRVEVRSGDDLRLLLQPAVDGAGGELRAVAFASDGRLYAGGALRGAAGHLLRRWERGGEGPFADLSASQAPITEIVPLPEGRVAFSAADPAWGVLAPDGRREVFVGGAHLPFRPESLRVDGPGRRVQVAEGLRFSIDDRALGAPERDLRGPRLDDPRLPVLDWQDGGSIQVGGTSVVIPSTVGRARSIFVAADGRSFLLGTDRVLYPTDPARVAQLGGGARGERVIKDLVAGFAIGLPAPALSLNDADEGRLYLAGLGDGTVRWYRAAERREVLGLFVHPDQKRWVLFTPGGFYDAAPGAEELIGWLVERPGQLGDLFPAGAFRARYRRPDVIDAVLGPGAGLAGAGGGPRGPLPPVVTILSPADGAAAGPELKLRVLVRSPVPLTSLRTLVDGRPVGRGVVALGPAPAAAPNPGAAPGEEQRELTVPLRGGESTVAVLADSAAGTSAPAVLHLGARKAEAGFELRPKLYLLAVGIGAYGDRDLRLQYPPKDARDLAAALKAQGGRLYRAVEARVLTDGAARRDDVLAGLEWLRKSATDLDVTVLFFAGHGIEDPGSGQYYFVPQDGDLQQPLRTMIADVQLRELLATLPGKVLLILDTCHAGKVLPGRGLRGGGSGWSRLVAELASAEGGVVVLAAATARQVAQEDRKWKNGAFTKALVEGLSGKADFQKTGRVTLDMLSLYVSERVKALTAGTQTPAVAKPGTIPDFPLAVTRP